VLDELEQNLIRAGSSMDKVLKVNVYLNDINDWARMNTVYAGAGARCLRCGQQWRRQAVFPVIRWWRSI
jgi:enamine deaminase RidA (YjgF/YER057c/UK114 family)